LQPFAPKPDAELQTAPVQWSLLAWAALVGVLTGVAVVGFHALYTRINGTLFGPFVEALLRIGHNSLLPLQLPAPPPTPVPPVSTAAGTPLEALLHIGLGGLGMVPPPPPPIEPPPLPSLQIPDWLRLWPVLVVPTLGGALVGILRRWLGEIGPGLPSLMAMADGAIDAAPRLPWLRLLAASVSLGSGASLGPEGPSVEAGGNVGLWLALKGRLTPQSQKALVAAGVAAGLAAGFKAPIAGVFFAFEGSFSGLGGRPSLRAVLVAAISATLVVQVGLGDTPILRLPAYDVRSLWELPLYLVLGVLASLMSWALIRLLELGRSPRLQQVLKQLPAGLPTAAGGLAVGLIALEFPQVLGVGYDTIEALLGSDGGVPLLTLVLLLGAKLLATGLSNALGVVGGGCAPSRVRGAVLGNCYGQLLGDSGLHLAVAAPPAYAMVGMAAVLAGSARAPLTALLLLFELTHDIRIVLPLMAAAGLSAGLVERWHGLHDPGLLGPDPDEEQRRSQLAALAVSDALEPEAPLLLEASTSAADGLAAVVEAHGHCLLLVNGPWVSGLVTLGDLQRCIGRGPGADGTPPSLQDSLRTDLVWLPASSQLSQLEDQLEAHDLRQVPVFTVPAEIAASLPQGLPPQGLPLQALVGVASRDGMARALARAKLNPVASRGTSGKPDQSS